MPFSLNDQNHQNFSVYAKKPFETFFWCFWKEESRTLHARLICWGTLTSVFLETGEKIKLLKEEKSYWECLEAITKTEAIIGADSSYLKLKKKEY